MRLRRRQLFILPLKLILLVKKQRSGHLLEKQADVTAYILNEAKLAIVPFHAFGADKTSTWYRLSVGTVKIEEIHEMFQKLKEALKKVK